MPQPTGSSPGWAWRATCCAAGQEAGCTSLERAASLVLARPAAPGHLALVWPPPKLSPTPVPPVPPPARAGLSQLL
jgi:hypothetical protein